MEVTDEPGCEASTPAQSGPSVPGVRYSTEVEEIFLCFRFPDFPLSAFPIAATLAA